MALSIKDEATDRLVRRYARLHRTSFTGAIRMAVSDALKREEQPVEDSDKASDDYLDFVRDIQARFAAAPTLDPREPDDILYDADGLPK